MWFTGKAVHVPDNMYKTPTISHTTLSLWLENAELQIPVWFFSDSALDTALMWGRGGGERLHSPIPGLTHGQSQQQGPQPCTKNQITASVLKFWEKKTFYRVFLLSVFIYCSHFLALPCALVSILPAIICVEIYKWQARSSTACRMSLPFHEKEVLS